jgi:hypothetical protein
VSIILSVFSVGALSATSFHAHRYTRGLLFLVLPLMVVFASIARSVDGSKSAASFALLVLLFLLQLASATPLVVCFVRGRGHWAARGGGDINHDGGANNGNLNNRNNSNINNNNSNGNNNNNNNNNGGRRGSQVHPGAAVEEGWGGANADGSENGGFGAGDRPSGNPILRMLAYIALGCRVGNGVGLAPDSGGGGGGGANARGPQQQQQQQQQQQHSRRQPIGRPPRGPGNSNPGGNGGGSARASARGSGSGSGGGGGGGGGPREYRIIAQEPAAYDADALRRLFCPICMLYYDRLYSTSCCRQHICDDCARE